MGVIKDEFSIDGGYLPNGDKTSSISAYTEKWNTFKDEISTLLNSNCSLTNLWERPFIPTNINVVSKSNHEKFILPIWAAKKMLHNDSHYLINEHKLNEVIKLNPIDFYHKLLSACHNNNQEFITIILKDGDFQDKFDEKLVNNLLTQFCRMNYPKLVKTLYNEPHLAKLVNINKSYDPFFIACLDGYTEIVKFLTESKNFKTPIESNLLRLGIEATLDKEKFELTKFFLESPTIMEKVNLSDLKTNLNKQIPYIKNEEMKKYLLNGILKEEIKKPKF